MPIDIFDTTDFTIGLLLWRSVFFERLIVITRKRHSSWSPLICGITYLDIFTDSTDVYTGSVVHMASFVASASSTVTKKLSLDTVVVVLTHPILQSASRAKDFLSACWCHLLASSFDLVAKLFFRSWRKNIWTVTRSGTLLKTSSSTGVCHLEELADVQKHICCLSR